jgi:hypothetical protein
MGGYQLGQKHFGIKHMMGAKLGAIKHGMGGKAIHPMVQHMLHQAMQAAPTLSGMKRTQVTLPDDQMPKVSRME